MEMQDPEQDKQKVIEEAEALLRGKALEDRDRVLSEMRAKRGDDIFASLPIKVVEDLRHFELDVHDVIQSIVLKGTVGSVTAWEVTTLDDQSLVVYDTEDGNVCGRFSEDGATLDLIALLYGIAGHSGLGEEISKRILEGTWPS